ncbi:antibiotic biosynthesis monooxygenase [Exiguobacterium sp. Helios]|uniref:putative quinol monooxygenase n=1 Tax=Exiguobacterium sp. Helios TaxID=2735868 RepID=UPI00165E34E7|nr:putative quinol monooxygenase [Exiguobacterium sp. Helios]QNR19573.1 antibiotic biosynthesis monooxygenase [Exiguobacterium sp. Helios]
MIAIEAKLEVQPAKRQEFLEATKTLIEGSRLEAGNISYDLFQSIEDENIFMMIEKWEDQAAIETHNTSAHFGQFVAFAQTALAKPLDVQSFNA